MNTQSVRRRQFVKQMLVAWGLPTLIPGRVFGGDGKPGANQRITVAAIGVGHRCGLLLEQLPEDAQLVALCDCNRPRAEDFKKKHKGDWPVYANYHEVLQRNDVDTVIVATQEFQRVLPCVHACQAGKDVYAEKPLCLYIHEGRFLVNTVRKHGRILQVGSQQRSMAMNRIACDYIRGGGLGKILEVRAVNYTGPHELPKLPFPEQPVPNGLDWNMWLNQAAWRAYNRSWMGGWRDMSGGEMTNWGAHGIDQVQWALGTDGTGPVETWPITPGPNGQVGIRYANGVEVHFVVEKGPMGGAIFIGEKGKLEINRNKFTSNPKEIAEELRAKVNVAEEERRWSDKLALWQAKWHMQDWLDCVRTRAIPAADVEIGHRSISVCHLANITRFVGRKLRWDPQSERFDGDDEANRWVVRPRRKGFELPQDA
jgi:predicted dehydrogenase